MSEEELINSFKLYLDELKNLCKRLHLNNGEDDADVTMLEKVLNLIEKQQNKIKDVKTRLEYYLMGNMSFNKEAQEEFKKLFKMLEE